MAQPRADGSRLSPAGPLTAELLPPLLQRFVELLGLAPTMELVRRFGGVRLYVPTPDRVTPDHPLAAIVGEAGLRALAGEFGGLPHFQLPKAERALKAARNQQIAADYKLKSAREIALEHGITEGQVVRILSAAGAQPPANRRQTSLF